MCVAGGHAHAVEAGRVLHAGVFFLEPIALADLGWLLLLCVMGIIGHFLLIKTYEVAEASAVQPFAYLQMPFAAAVGMAAFGETLRTNVAIGAAIIIGAGIFVIWRERQLEGKQD